jgi:hypothetical protein
MTPGPPGPFAPGPGRPMPANAHGRRSLWPASRELPAGRPPVPREGPRPPDHAPESNSTSPSASSVRQHR